MTIPRTLIRLWAGIIAGALANAAEMPIRNWRRVVMRKPLSLPVGHILHWRNHLAEAWAGWWGVQPRPDALLIWVRPFQRPGSKYFADGFLFHHQPEAQHSKSSAFHNNAGRLPHRSGVKP